MTLHRWLPQPPRPLWEHTLSGSPTSMVEGSPPAALVLATSHPATPLCQMWGLRLLGPGGTPGPTHAGFWPRRAVRPAAHPPFRPSGHCCSGTRARQSRSNTPATCASGSVPRGVICVTEEHGPGVMVLSLCLERSHPGREALHGASLHTWTLFPAIPWLPLLLARCLAVTLWDTQT